MGCEVEEDFGFWVLGFGMGEVAGFPSVIFSLRFENDWVLTIRDFTILYYSLFYILYSLLPPPRGREY